MLTLALIGNTVASVLACFLSLLFCGIAAILQQHSMQARSQKPPTDGQIIQDAMTEAGYVSRINAAVIRFFYPLFFVAIGHLILKEVFDG